ncbi:MAG: solute carrier family 23 protein, partial [Methanoregula sp.]|nr:solute carrier family 23 protein [Methanoregula sp.]
GIIDSSTYLAFETAPLFAVPDLSYFGVSFSPALLIPFIVATICSSFKNVGDISICQKVGDLDWKRPEFSSISNGILSDGITTTVGGLLGGVGQSSSSSNIGLALATRAISRYIAFAAGAILIFLAFFPKIATVFLVMPPPVMGAALVYMGSFMIVAGFGILTSRMLDARKTFVIGVSLMFGIGAYIIPDAFSPMDPLISPFFESGLALATILAICLNMIVRIGVGKEETLVLSASDPMADRVFAYMEMAGETFGARREVIAQASHAVSQTCDALIDFGLSKSDIKITTRFDDLNLDIAIRYHGDTLPLPTCCPSENELLEDETAMVNLSGFLIRNYADAIQSVCKNGDCTISIHYDH